MSDNIGISLAGIIDIVSEYGIEIRKTGNNIEWKFQGETDEFWRLLIDATELNSQIIEMQRGETSLQWRIVGSDEWIDLISYDDIAYIGTQPIRTKFHNRLTIGGRLLQDNDSPPEPIDYMGGQPLCWRDGEYYDTNYLPMSPTNTKNTFIVTSNKLKLWPIKIMNPSSIVDLGFSVVTEAADSSIKVLIYNGDELAGVPTTKLFESESFDCSSSGNKLNTIPFFIEDGYYFIGYQKTGEGTPTLRSIADTSYNIISSFSTLELAGDNASNIDLTKSCYQYNEIVDNLTEVEYEISGSDRVIFATLRANSRGEIYLESLIQTEIAIRDVVVSAHDNCYYILTINKLYKTNDLINMIEIPYIVDDYTTSFTSVCECSDGIVVVDNNNLWIKKHNSNELIITSLEIPKNYYAQTATIDIYGHIDDDYIFASYVNSSGSTITIRQYNMLTYVNQRNFTGANGLYAHHPVRGERCSNGVWVFVGGGNDNCRISIVDWRDNSVTAKVIYGVDGNPFCGLSVDNYNDSIWVNYCSAGTGKERKYIKSEDYGVTWSSAQTMISRYTDDSFWGLSMKNLKVHVLSRPSASVSSFKWANNNYDSYYVTQSIITSVIRNMLHIQNIEDQRFMIAQSNGNCYIFKYIFNE